MGNIAAIGVAGLLGTLCRYWLSNAVDARSASGFPWGTLSVNLLGCLVIGFLFHLFSHRFPIDATLRAAIFIGLLGGFTTFSSFGIQTFNLLRDGQLAHAGAYIALSNLGGLLCVWAGHAAARLVP